jgi:hypothetical protein
LPKFCLAHKHAKVPIPKLSITGFPRALPRPAFEAAAPRSSLKDAKAASKGRRNPKGSFGSACEKCAAPEEAKERQHSGPDRSKSTMKFFTGCVASAVLALVTTAADAQVPPSGTLRGPIITASDFDGPYGAPDAQPPRPQGYGYGYERGPVPALLPAGEVYAVLRDNGFSPLGAPRLRGDVYTIAVIDPRGDDGRLVIDARDGRILRFMPASGFGFGSSFGIGPAYDERAVDSYGPQGALPPPTAIRSGPPRPPALIPHVAWSAQQKNAPGHRGVFATWMVSTRFTQRPSRPNHRSPGGLARRR